MTDSQFEDLLREALENCTDDYIEVKEEWYQPFEYSWRFKRKMRRLMRQSFAWDIPKIKLTPKRFVVFTVMISLLTAAVFNSSAKSRNINGFFIEEYVDHTIFTLPGATGKTSIEEKYEITYDLSDFEEGPIEQDLHSVDRFFEKNGEDKIEYIYYSQFLIMDMRNYDWSAENLEIEPLKINGFNAIYWERDRSIEMIRHVIWYNNDYVFSIFVSNIEKDELIAIAESVKPINKINRRSLK